MSNTVPLGPQLGWLDGHNACSYNPNPALSPVGDCGQPSAIHIRLADDQGFIAACTKHQQYALQALTWIDYHPWMAWCNMPGALWFPSPTPDEADSWCSLDDSGAQPAFASEAEVNA
jgi:hypothetical protein